jgi:hypothetical protein
MDNDYEFCDWGFDTNSTEFKVFKDVVSRTSGRWYETQTFAEASLFIYSNMRQFLSDFRDAVKSFFKLEQDIYLAFVPHFDVNAYAFRHGALDLVGLYFGLACRLLDISFALFSTPSFAPEIGNPGLEQRPEDEIREIILRRYTMRNFADWKAARLRPKCPERLSVAMDVCFNGAMFVLAHELGHIILNHLDDPVVSSVGGGKALLELNNEEEISDSLCSYRQLLEYEADRFALKVMLFLRTECWRAPEIETLRQFCLGLEVFFRILDLYAKPNTSIRGGTHPLPAVRSVLMFLDGIETFGKEKPEARNEFREIWGWTKIRVQNFWAQIGLGEEGSFSIDMREALGEAKRLAILSMDKDEGKLNIASLLGESDKGARILSFPVNKMRRRDSR